MAQLGVGGLVALMAEITEQQSDYFLLSGERQKAAQCMRDFRILQRAAHALGHEGRATGTERGQEEDMDSQWYKDAVLYELDVRSFSDGDGDGVGDLPGLTDKLDYLQDLGVTALILGLSPQAPERQDAHHVAGHPSACGFVQDLERFLPEAHARGIRVITELLVSQLSDQALNVEHPRLRTRGAESHAPLVGRGGGRADTCRHSQSCRWRNSHRQRLAETHRLVKEMRALIDQQYAERVLLARTTHSPDDATTYFGDGDECHMAFNLSLMARLLIALNSEDRRPLVQGLRGTLEIPASCQWALFLRHQDELNLGDVCADAERAAIDQALLSIPRRGSTRGVCRRLAPLFDNDRRRIELGYGLLFSLPGSPVIYYGDEIGMGDSVEVAAARACETPMQWSDDRNRGFSQADPARLYAPVNADPVYGYRAVNVEAQRRQPFSLLNWTRRLIAVRREHAAFGRGTIDFLDPRNPSVFAYVRRHGDERILVVANISGHAQSVDLFLGPYAGAQPIDLLGGTRFRRYRCRPVFPGARAVLVLLVPAQPPRGSTDPAV